MNEEIKRIEFDKIYKNLTNKYLEHEQCLESFFTQVFIRVSKTNQPLEGLCFYNFYTDNNMISFCVSDYDTRKATIEIIEYVDFIISLFVKIANSTFKVDSYYICSLMFKFMKNNYIDNSNETILEFLEKKYLHINFLEGDFGQDIIDFKKT